MASFACRCSSASATPSEGDGDDWREGSEEANGIGDAVRRRTQFTRWMGSITKGMSTFVGRS